MFKNFHKNKYIRGVTLIELIVVIFIFTMISTMTIFNYGKFRSSLSIQNLADDIALSVRRAQGFAIGVRGSSVGGFEPGFGIHFTANPSSPISAGSNKSFILFTDLGTSNYRMYDYNSSYTCGTSSSECLEALNITSADSIKSIYLNDTTVLSLTDTVDIFFKRPAPEPTFCFRSGGTGSCIGSISSVKIRVSTDADSSIYKEITISNNGQISVSGSI